jgi:hypothetical protein
VGASVTRGGAGLVDARAATHAKLVVEPAALAFGRAGGQGWNASQTITVTNVSRRAHEIGFAFTPDAGSSAIEFTAEPAKLNLGPHASAEVSVGVSATAGAPTGGSGIFLATAQGVASTRVPWAVGTRPAGATDLVGPPSLSNWEFAPSDTAPSVLAFRAGRVVGGSVEGVSVLDVELWTLQGKKLGVIASLRDLLPGRYAFGLTGRDANGKILAPGTYVLRLRAQPVDAEEGTPPSTSQTVFRIKESS